MGLTIKKTYDGRREADDEREEAIEEGARELERSVHATPCAIPRVEGVRLAEHILERNLHVIIDRLLVAHRHIDADAHLLQRIKDKLKVPKVKVLKA